MTVEGKQEIVEGTEKTALFPPFAPVHFSFVFRRKMKSLATLFEGLSHEPVLRFLLIGGHAVIAHGYPRTTFDVDLLVEKSARDTWLGRLKSLGYELQREEASFLQLNPPAEGLDLDLMLVSGQTFEQIWRQGGIIRIESQAVHIPSLDHLLALKLHVLKQNLRHRAVKDLDDIIRLVLANRLDITSEHYRRLFEKYGTDEDYTRVISATR